MEIKHRDGFPRGWIFGTAFLGIVLAASFASAQKPAEPSAKRPPNIIFILADDLGHADLGCYGQEKIKTPCIDKMAAEGMRFNQAYCGTSVCAPSRCALMTGLHMGHAYIRANREIKPEGQEPLPPNTFTVAKLLKESGYATACIGKWGLGFVGTSGDPLKNGFDHFFGYNCQRKAHTYYPEYLWRNDQKVPLDGNTYSHDLMTAEALGWIKDHKDKPFFLYLPYTSPHEEIAVPELEPYTKDQPWTQHQKVYASIVSRMDRDIGRILDELKELKLDDNTLVIFASDNGQDNKEAKFFRSNADLRGTKRSMYEGGIRAPFVARWPGKIKAGSVDSTSIIAFWDFLPTVAELSGAKIPAGQNLDGISYAGVLHGGSLPQRDHLYWELHEGRFIQAVRQGDWKAVRNGPSGDVELYNLREDPSEKNDVAAEHPDRVAALEKLLKSERVDTPLWPIKANKPKDKKPKKA